ncbi:MAG: competence/damage-inducible protein A [Planctomycetota bacterium]|jgi:nicotinamide-nucleotide amidase
MKAIIIAVGDELISGVTVDTNSAYLAEQLAKRGIATEAHWTIGDDEEAIAEAIKRAASCAGLVVMTGGLGPTKDDLTRQGLAKAVDAQLTLDEASLARIEDFFRIRGRHMQPSNRIQAMIPAGAEALANSRGTAPGIAAGLGNTRIFVLPGVPHEMKAMFERRLLPRLPEQEAVISTRTVQTFGLGESDIASQIADLMDRKNNVSVGITVSAGLVSLRVTARARSARAGRRRLESVVRQIKDRLGKLVVAEDEATMASVVGELLRKRGEHLATAESCTGGLVGQLISSVPGSSDYYLGGVVAYANEVKRDSLGVDEKLLAAYGAVSEQVAAAMAEGCRERFASDWAVSVTGIAGPSGGTAEKPVGLVYVGVSGTGDTEVHEHILPGDRQTVRLRTALAALNYLRLALVTRA